MEIRGRAMKKYFYLTLLFVVIGLGVWRWNIGAHEWLTKHSLSQIQELQKTFIFQWESMNVNSTLFKVRFTNVRIQPKDTAPFQRELAPKELTIQIAPWASLMERSLMLNITANTFKYQINLSQSSNEDLFNLFESLPINKITLKSAHLSLVSPKGIILAPQTEMQLRKKRNALSMEINTRPILQDSSFFFQGRFYLTKDQIDIISLNINNDTSQLSSSGKIVGSKKIEELFLDIQSDFDAKDLRKWMEPWMKPFDIQGFFNIKSKIKYSKEEGLTGPFELLSKNFLWEHIEISQIKMKGNFENRLINLEMAHFEKEKGFTSYFEKTQIHLNEDNSFTLTNYSSIEDFSAVERILGWNSSIQFQGQLQSHCTGRFLKPQMKCSMQLNMQDIYMASNTSEEPHIFEMEKGQLISNFVWTPNQSTLQGHLLVGFASDSRMSFEGVIKNNQAKISFDGPVNFEHVQHIYGFSLKGLALKWKGKMTLSDSDLSIFSSIDLNNLYFANYLFGNVKTNLKLNKRGLYLNKIRAQLGKSRYKGRLHILFTENKIQTQAQLAPLFLEDLSSSVKNVITIPLNLIGKGQAKLSMDSPFNRLSYQVNSQFQNVKIYDEFFRMLIVNITSQNGLAKITKAVAEKSKDSFIQASGVLKTSNQLDLKLEGSNLPIEKSENFNRWIHLSGILNFQMGITGLLTDPVGDLSGAITAPHRKNLAKVTMKLTPNLISGEGDLFNGDLLIRNFKLFPDQKNISFFAAAEDWNFIQLTRNHPSLVTSKVTGKASLHFSKDLKKPSGFADIEEINIQYGLNQSSHSDSIYMEFNKGRFSFRGSSVKWKTNENEMILTKVNSNYSKLSGIIGLEIFNLLFPQIKNIGGQLQANLKIRNNFNQLSPEGTIKLEKSMININNHINPFQSIQMNGTIKSQVMRINQLTALTPLGGSVEVSGLVDFSEPNFLPLDISARLNDKVAVYLSDKIHGVGYGNIKIYGDRTPYTLSGLFNVRTGSFKQEFDSTEEQKETEFVLLDSDPNDIYPFYWDLKVKFDNPFPVENTLFSSLINGSFHIKGDFLNPSASGQITFIPGGSFYIRDYDFEIISGRLNYSSQSIYEPQLQIIGATQFEETRYDNERETTAQYNITADITGTPSSFQFELSSQPALSESDILSMMALGARSIGDSFVGFSPAQIIQSQVAKYSYAQIGAVLFQDIFGRELNKSLGLRLSFTPYMSLNRNKPSNKIGIHKRWFEKMNTSYIGSLERDYDSFKVEYMLSPAFSLLGVWEKKETLNQDQSNTLGLEFEYKLDF